MRTVCPVCNAQYKISGDKLSQQVVQTVCKKCGGMIVVEPKADGEVVLDGQIGSQVASVASDASGAKGFVQQPRNWSASELTLIQEYPELKGIACEKLDLAEIFSPGKHGTFKNRKNNYKLKIIKAVHQLLDRMLRPGERVMRIGKATAYYPAEIIFGNGYLTTLYNHYAVVGTNRRLLLINVNPKISKPTHYYFQLPYGSIKKVKRGLFGRSLVLRRASGKRRTFIGMKNYLARELKHFIQERQQRVRSAKPTAAVAENLCPSCFLALPENLPQCPKCEATFKRPTTAFFRSLLLPGLGDLYLGHRFLGTLELVGSVVVWVFVILALLSSSQETLIVALFVLVLYNGFDGLLTRHMARKGYMLASK
ncbi:MAG: hypothetical protein JSU72_10515 [Deltaproteobacteria bacterium]|nr:MAG: hypothetical protein JSU72_10515 [Deltaproteobacteria bacterium]